MSGQFLHIIYGIYLAGGLALDKIDLEVRYYTGNRNRSDISRSASRFGGFGTYFF
ncbi:MAG: hypothetical protein ACJAZ9_001525 [Neolewinella sp.]